QCRRGGTGMPTGFRWKWAQAVRALGVLLALAVAPAHAASTAHDVADFLSGKGNLIFLGAGIVEPILTDHKNGTGHTLREIDAIATSVAASEILKLATHERRPDD